jgi:predicted RNase H-like nuclease
MSSDERSDPSIWLAGIDACKRGWMVALVRPDGAEVRLLVCNDFAAVVALPERPALIGIDIPVGLPARGGKGGRDAERLVRPLLGARRASVFSVSSRAAMYAATHPEASAIARATSDPPSGMSIQTFCIGPKVRQVDGILLADASLAERIFEVHPEVAFWRLNGERPLTLAKRVKGRPHPPGLDLRRQLLAAAGLSAAGLVPPKGAQADDLLDALACAAVARRLWRGEGKPFPDPPPRDARGPAHGHLGLTALQNGSSLALRNGNDFPP